MNLDLSKPILYLITRGATAESTTPASAEFQEILIQIRAAVTANIQLIQLREKKITARVLFELARQASALTRGSASRILVNDRADIAAAAGADGVHLTTRSLAAAIVRKTFGSSFLIGVSTHSALQARDAREGFADFVVFGPVFPTPSKNKYGSPLGLVELATTARALEPFPVLAIGGLSIKNAQPCLEAGAAGVAAIRLFSDVNSIHTQVEMIRGKPEQTT